MASMKICELAGIQLTLPNQIRRQSSPGRLFSPRLTGDDEERYRCRDSPRASNNFRRTKEWNGKKYSLYCEPITLA